MNSWQPKCTKLALTLSCLAVFAMTQKSNAQVIVEFKQVGLDVVATWTGSLDPGEFLRSQTISGYGIGTKSLMSLSGDNNVWNSGIASKTLLSLGNISMTTGGSYGFDNGKFYYADSDSAASSIIDFDSATHTMTWSNKTLETGNADAYNNTLAWTSSAGSSNTISYTTVVPEPSSIALLSLGAAGIIGRRRRQSAT